MTAKESALEINPLFKAYKINGLWQVQIYSNVYGVPCKSPNKAWESALEHLNSTRYKEGDYVVMENCMEAHNPKQKIWKCRTDSFQSINKDIVVFLENFFGYFHCYFLRSATDEEITEFLKVA